MKTSLIRTMADSYVKSMVPEGASEAQIEQTRFAFIAGCSAMFEKMLNAGTGDYAHAAVMFDAIEKEIATIISDLDSPPSTEEVTH